MVNLCVVQSIKCSLSHHIYAMLPERRSTANCDCQIFCSKYTCKHTNVFYPMRREPQRACISFSRSYLNGNPHKQTTKAYAKGMNKTRVGSLYNHHVGRRFIYIHDTTTMHNRIGNAEFATQKNTLYTRGAYARRPYIMVFERTAAKVFSLQVPRPFAF